MAYDTATLPLLGVLFLDHLLELVRSLAQLREGLLYGIGFLSAFPFWRGNRIFPFRLSRNDGNGEYCASCTRPLLAKVAVFLGTSFPRDSGDSSSTRSLCTLFIAVRRFLVARSDRLVGSFLATYALGCLERDRRSERMST